MTEGQGSKTFSVARKILYTNPTLAHKLLDTITTVTINYLKAQVNAGAHMLQVFDSWAGILGPDQYAEFGLRYLKRIANAINEVPLTLFSKGAHHSYTELAKMECNTIGVDWQIDMAKARELVGDNRTLQGNLDPCALYSSHENVQNMTINMLKSFDNKRHIVNLGHGVYPDVDPEKVKTFVQTVKNFKR
jgi:uroporphyrinogen decarboxylase